MSENLIRDVHDSVADSKNPAEASVRPPGTTPRELNAMRGDVLRKLRLRPGMSVVEIGCGVGLLGVPVAQGSGRYVGLDFAPRSVQVANERLRAAGVSHRARALCVDLLSASEEDLRELGRFDRLLMYAVFHYARDQREALLFLHRAVDLLVPGGRALIGNIPLEDLRTDWTPESPPSQTLPARLIATGRWVGKRGGAQVPLTRRWKARHVIEATIKSRSSSSVDLFAVARLPAGYTLTMTVTDVERWLATLEGDTTYRWQLPAPGVPLAPARADLILVRG